MPYLPGWAEVGCQPRRNDTGRCSDGGLIRAAPTHRAFTHGGEAGRRRKGDGPSQYSSGRDRSERNQRSASSFPRRGHTARAREHALWGRAAGTGRDRVQIATMLADLPPSGHCVRK